MKDNFEELIEEMDMGEEFAKLAETYADNFTITGKETTDLSEALERASESLLDMIWEEYGVEAAEELTRKEKEIKLYEDIPLSLSEDIIYLRREELELLLRVMNNEPIADIEAAQVQELFGSRGWVFTFTENNACIFVVMDQVRSILIQSLEDEEKQAMLGFVWIVRMALQACLNLYGVFKKELLAHMTLSLLNKPEKLEGARGGEPESFREGIKELIEQMLNILEETEGEFWFDGDYVVSVDFENRADYKQLLRKTKGMAYYMPSREEIELYSENLIDTKNTNYTELMEILEKETKDRQRADNYLYEIEYKVVEEDISVSEIMECLFDFRVSFHNENRRKRFLELLNQWLYEVKRWSNRGYSNQELSISIKEEKYIAVERHMKGIGNDTSNKIEKKPGRNDPCPCGSGKKYKKCCLGKVTI